MRIIGIDLSGPSNVADTVLTAFDMNRRSLKLRQTVLHATDADLHECVADLCRQSRVVVGIDAPLSYNDGGGDRPGDARLRRAAVDAGMHPGSIMPPTMTRMVYLTLRGVSVARQLSEIKRNKPQIVEVHPGATMVFRGAPLTQVRGMKDDGGARRRLLKWLELRGLKGVGRAESPSDHFVAACAAALAAWDWHEHRSTWLQTADSPQHPFDFAC